MKYYFTLFFFLGLYSAQAQAQPQVQEVRYVMSLGEQNAFMMDHQDADGKMVADVIEKILKEYGKIKRNREAGEWYCEECTIHAISHESIQLYYKVEGRRNMSTSYLFFDDNTQFISSDNAPEKAAAVREIAMEIFYEVKRELLRIEIEDMEEMLKDFEKDLSKLVKKNSELHEDIEEYKDKIRKAEKDIEENLGAQQDRTMEIEKQKLQIKSTIEKLNKIRLKEK